MEGPARSAGPSRPHLRDDDHVSGFRSLGERAASGREHRCRRGGRSRRGPRPVWGRQGFIKAASFDSVSTQKPHAVGRQHHRWGTAGTARQPTIPRSRGAAHPVSAN